jgi:hypothetical protein
MVTAAGLGVPRVAPRGLASHTPKVSLGSSIVSGRMSIVKDLTAWPASKCSVTGVAAESDPLSALPSVVKTDVDILVGPGLVVSVD